MEEEKNGGDIDSSSSDLELFYDDEDQVVAIQFSSIRVPFGAKVNEAHINFQVDEE